jgi:hypothetical protein
LTLTSGESLPSTAEVIGMSWTIGRVDHLRRQYALLTERLGELQRTITAVARTMEARTMGINLEPDELFEVFGDTGPGRYADEAEERWADTDAYRESQLRTSGYGDMNTADERFTAHYDVRAPGLAGWVRDAIHANADRR